MSIGNVNVDNIETIDDLLSSIYIGGDEVEKVDKIDGKIIIWNVHFENFNIITNLHNVEFMNCIFLNCNFNSFDYCAFDECEFTNCQFPHKFLSYVNKTSFTSCSGNINFTNVKLKSVTFLFCAKMNLQISN